ncbi:expressed unknown protein [Seminavis robusta]|uniref:Uncharacterized protein n=1 Tax=Seminavis robusta TaxID=568900 RepID=A0A9N8HCN0_9STRA|nr:expressed unknown protein [Seminavis robusta]|eukprot:Sro226_g091930.1 n/a (187) ;mRNA; r:2313-2873
MPAKRTTSTNSNLSNLSEEQLQEYIFDALEKKPITGTSEAGSEEEESTPQVIVIRRSARPSGSRSSSRSPTRPSSRSPAASRSPTRRTKAQRTKSASSYSKRGSTAIDPAKIITMLEDFAGKDDNTAGEYLQFLKKNEPKTEASPYRPTRRARTRSPMPRTRSAAGLSKSLRSSSVKNLIPASTAA